MQLRQFLILLILEYSQVVLAQKVDLITPRPFPNVISGLLFSPDNKFLLITGDNKLQLWDLKFSCFVKELSADSFQAGGAQFTADGKYLVCYTAYPPMEVVVWNLENLSLKSRFRASMTEYKTPVLSATGYYMYTFSQSAKFGNGDTLNIYTLETGTLLKQFETAKSMPDELGLDPVNGAFISSESATSFMDHMPKHLSLVNLHNFQSENLDWVMDEAKKGDEFFQSATIIDSSTTVLLTTRTNESEAGKDGTMFRFYSLKTRIKMSELKGDFLMFSMLAGYKNDQVLLSNITRNNGQSNHLAWFNSRSSAISETDFKPEELVITKVTGLNNPRLFLFETYQKDNSHNRALYIFDAAKKSFQAVPSENNAPIYYYSVDPNSCNIVIFNNHKVKIINTESCQITDTFKVPALADYTDPLIRISDDSKYLCFTDTAQSIIIYKPGKPLPYRLLKPRLTQYLCVSRFLSWNDRYIYSTLGSQPGVLWDRFTGQSVTGDWKNGKLDLKVPLADFDLVNHYANKNYTYNLINRSSSDTVFTFSSSHYLNYELASSANKKLVVLKINDFHNSVDTFSIFDLHQHPLTEHVLTGEDISSGNTMNCSPDGKYFIYTTSPSWDHNFLNIYDVGRHTLVGHYPKTGYGDNNFISPDYSRILSCDSAFFWPYLQLRNLENGKIIQAYQASKRSNTQSFYDNPVFSKTGDIFVLPDQAGTCTIYNSSTGKEIAELNLAESGLIYCRLCQNNNNLLVAQNKAVGLYNIKSGRLIRNYPSTTDNVLNIEFTGDERYFLVSTINGASYLYETDNGTLVASFISTGSESTICRTPDNFYTASKGITKELNFRMGSNAYSFQQFDVTNNRPDIVASRLGNPDTALVKSFYGAWQKRMRKLDLDTAKFSQQVSLPESDFENRDGISYQQANPKLNLVITGKDKNVKLQSYNVWVNDVPVFGMRGINISKEGLHELRRTIELNLSDGENRLEASVTNINGIESYRIPLLVSYNQPKPKQEKLYFVGIGINRFKDNTHPLNWCVKDIRDLADSLHNRYGTNIVIDTLFDEMVSQKNVKKIKDLLLKSTVDDKVIIAYSGHGLVSKSYDYYLSTYDINFARPEYGGLPYDDLEGLLDSIPARKKLMLIDACNSGELDADEAKVTEATLAAAGKKGLTIVTYPGEKNLGLKNSFELMQDLFANVGRGTGATVLSAAGGTQAAREDAEHSNGYFTFSILEMMGSNPTAKVSELSSYVSKRVEELSNGLQKPTSRKENTTNDWTVW